HSASMFRRAIWDSSSGFDESLPALEHYEFWLRVLAAGGHCSWIEEPSLIRELRKDSHWYRDSGETTHLAAMASILRAHDAVFRDHAAAVLYAKERVLTGGGQQYRQRM